MPYTAWSPSSNEAVLTSRKCQIVTQHTFFHQRWHMTYHLPPLLALSLLQYLPDKLMRRAWHACILKHRGSLENPLFSYTTSSMIACGLCCPVIYWAASKSQKIYITWHMTQIYTIHQMSRTLLPNINEINHHKSSIINKIIKLRIKQTGQNRSS